MTSVDLSSPTIVKYKKQMMRILHSVLPWLSGDELSYAIDYSIKKRWKDTPAKLHNNYTNELAHVTINQMTDYVLSKEPIITSYGVLFRKHGEVPNPTIDVIDGFLINRGIHKKEMFKYPKGSDMFERYNLIQNLDKIDANGVYGLEGLYLSIIYNLHVAPSITAMGRSMISSAIMCFEMFLSNNVQFGGLDEIIVFIDNVRMEAGDWKFDDRVILDSPITKEECFYKLIITCGYKYIPTEGDLDIVWRIIQNCSQVELNRLYYKNNLYSFMDNRICRELIFNILSNLKTPYMEPMKPPTEIEKPLVYLRDLLLEYVFYNYQIIDRIDRNKNMVKNISIISDTDSSFVSLDAWYHYVLDIVKGYDFKILHQNIDIVEYCENIYKKTGREIDPTDKVKGIEFFDVDKWGDPVNPNQFAGITFDDPVLDYDFYNDEIIERQRMANALEIIPQDNLKFSIINIMAYILDAVINQYMIDFTKQSFSYRGDSACRLKMKNEFYMYRVLLMDVKKHYAALQGVQEGNFLGVGGKADIKGIDCIAKTTFSDTTRKALKRILLEDILKAPYIDQVKIFKDISILENQIYTDVNSGSKKYYKPLTVKSASHYAAPLSEQGVKGSIVWNYIKTDDLPALDLNERNSVDIAKIDIRMSTVEKIKDDYPEVYEKIKQLIDPESVAMIWEKPVKDIFKGIITSIAIPKDTPVPKWLLPFIDIEQIISDNISGFPLSSVGMSKLDNRKGVTYTNIVQL